MFRLARRGGIAYLEAAGLAALAGVTHAFCLRRGGVSPAPYESLNTGFLVADSRPNVLANLDRVARAFAVPQGGLILMGQVHGDRIRVLDGGALPSEPVPECDGLITDRPGVALGIRTADCVPILFVDPVRRVIGVAHAGWRGTALGIAMAMVDALRDRFATRPGDLRAAIGPAIGPCCYQVDIPVMAALSAGWDTSTFLTPCPEEGRWMLDLAAANRIQLLESGLDPGRIFSARQCTACRPDRFFSHRGEAGRTGRLVNLLMLSEKGPGKGGEKRA